jgi:hypothetical protein
MTEPPTSGQPGDAMSVLRRALALLGCALALSAAAAPPPAIASSHSHHAHKQVARAALARLLAGHSYDGIRFDVTHVVTATVCFHGACSTERLRAEPTCDPAASACIGTALRAWRPNRVTTIEVELL